MVRKSGNYKRAFLTGMVLALSWLLLTGETRFFRGTSMDYRYNAEFVMVLNNYLDFKEIYNAEYSFPIPGLANTSLNEGICTQMVPQGICSAGDYILISAYDNGSEDREKPYHSVIYILSNKEGRKRQLLTVLELPDVTHAGACL